MRDSEAIETRRRAPSDVWAKSLRGAIAPCVVALVAVIAAIAAIAAPSSQEPAKIAPPDAIIKRWVQHWTVGADGGVAYRVVRHVQINSDRAHGEFADPRISYNADTQSVKIAVARTRLPDGKTIVELPSYGRTEVAPGGTAGVPSLAAIRQIVLVMSGIEPGCVVELDYTINTKPGTAPLCADLALAERHPIDEREIRIDLPRGVWLSQALTNVAEGEVEYSFEQRSDGGSTHLLVVPRLPTIRDEPAAPGWRSRAPRFTFTMAPGKDWLAHRLGDLASLADESPLLSRLAQEWTRDRTTTEDKLRAAQEKLAATFNIHDVDLSLPLPPPRRASDALASNYGTQVEAAAVLLSLCRAAGLAASPALVLDDDMWVEKSPQDALVSAFAVAAGSGDDVTFWHPRDGRIARGKRWNGFTLAWPQGADVQRRELPAWSKPDESRCAVALDATVADNATLSGKASVRLSGLFVAADSLRTTDSQTARVREIVRGVLPGVDVSGVTVRTLSGDVFEADAQIKSVKPLEALGATYKVALGDGPASGDVSLPFSSAKRTLPVRLAGAFEESCELALTLPEKWTFDAFPAAAINASGEWGAGRRSAEMKDRTLRLSRTVRVSSNELPAAQWLAARDALLELRGERSRSVLIRK